MGFFFGDQGKAAREAAKQQRRQYEQQVNEQRNAAILQGENIADNIATINVGGGDTYEDDPFARRNKTKNRLSSKQLGIY